MRQPNKRPVLEISISSLWEVQPVMKINSGRSGSVLGDLPKPGAYGDSTDSTPTAACPVVFSICFSYLPTWEGVPSY